MTGFLLTSLFAACAALALASIVASLRRYGPAACNLRRQLQECPEWREVRSTVVLTEVKSVGATILRIKFRPDQPHAARRPVLRAAA